MPMHDVPQGITNPPRPVSQSDVDAVEATANGWMGPAPGTLILVFVFLAAFVTYFFTNWKILSFLWKIG
jgi:hypothetical protein